MDIFIREWFAHPQWWFSKSLEYDEYIQSKFEGLLDISWSCRDSIIGRILVWDQLPRHVFRGQSANHILEYFLTKAIQVVQEFEEIERMDEDEYPLTDEEFMFLWLPYRHTKKYRYVLPVMKKVWRRLSAKPDSEIMKKFIRATFMNHPTLDQDAMLYTNATTSSWDEELDIACFRNILDYDGMETTLEGPPNDMGDFNDLSRVSSAIVSLSGGVDSMVCVDYIRRTYPHLHLAAVHINYDNRETSKEEAAFVEWWCARNHIALYTRTIHEIHRPMCMKHGLREIYETYTKNVRFGTYCTVWRQMEQEGVPVVVLGHNEDDCFENFLTNSTYRCKYDDLRGMKKWSEQDGIRFFRPMLVIPKRKIVSYAKALGIPYLYDSTPSWSQRGKIRDHVVPTLHQWNPQCTSGMLQLATIMTELFTVMRSTVEEWSSAMTSVEPGVYERVVATPQLSDLFWKDLFMKCFRICPSNRSIKNFVNRLQSLDHDCEVNVWYKMVLSKTLCVEYRRMKDARICYRFRVTQ